LLLALLGVGVYAVFALGLEMDSLLFVALVPSAISGARAADRWPTAVTVGARVGVLGGLAVILALFLFQSVRSFTAIGQAFPLTFSGLGLLIGLAIVPVFGIEGTIGGYVGFVLARGLAAARDDPEREP
jgi:hypothetical protein